MPYSFWLRHCWRISSRRRDAPDNLRIPCIYVSRACYRRCFVFRQCIHGGQRVMSSNFKHFRQLHGYPPHTKTEAVQTMSAAGTRTLVATYVSHSCNLSLATAERNEQLVYQLQKQNAAAPLVKLFVFLGCYIWQYPQTGVRKRYMLPLRSCFKEAFISSTPHATANGECGSLM